jgi:hypothetical protein
MVSIRELTVMKVNVFNPADYLSTPDAGDATGSRYRDFSNAVDPRAGTASTSQSHENESARRSESEIRFPARLHYMLNDINNDESMR